REPRAAWQVLEPSRVFPEIVTNGNRTEIAAPCSNAFLIMSYEIKLHGRVGSALQEVAREEMTRALQAYGVLKTDQVAEAVHQIRKRIKKPRALLALLREPLGKEQYRVEDADLRKVGRALSAKRDAEVLLKTLTHLQQRFFPGRPSALIQALHK